MDNIKVSKIIIAFSFCLVLLTSSVAVFFSFSNYTVTISAVRQSIDNIRDVFRSDSLNSGKLNGHNNNTIDDIDRILDRLESAKDSSFNGNTISFLSTVFSILFISVGMYLYSKTNEQLNSLLDNLRLQNWTTTSNIFLSYLLSLETLTNESNVDDYSVVNIIVDSRLYFDHINNIYSNMKSDRIGISPEQIELLVQLSSGINSRYALIRTKIHDEENISVIEDFQSRVQNLGRKLYNEQFVKRWNQLFSKIEK